MFTLEESALLARLLRFAGRVLLAGGLGVVLWLAYLWLVRGRAG